MAVKGLIDTAKLTLVYAKVILEHRFTGKSILQHRVLSLEPPDAVVYVAARLIERSIFRIGRLHHSLFPFKVSVDGHELSRWRTNNQWNVNVHAILLMAIKRQTMVEMNAQCSQQNAEINIIWTKYKSQPGKLYKLFIWSARQRIVYKYYCTLTHLNVWTLNSVARSCYAEHLYKTTV